MADVTVSIKLPKGIQISSHISVQTPTPSCVPSHPCLHLIIQALSLFLIRLVILSLISKISLLQNILSNNYICYNIFQNECCFKTITLLWRRIVIPDNRSVIWLMTHSYSLLTSVTGREIKKEPSQCVLHMP